MRIWASGVPHCFAWVLNLFHEGKIMNQVVASLFLPGCFKYHIYIYIYIYIYTYIYIYIYICVKSSPRVIQKADMYRGPKRLSLGVRLVRRDWFRVVEASGL